jgi:hypothetical protein
MRSCSTAVSCFRLSKAVPPRTRALERFLAGDMAGAAAALGKARQVNPWVEDDLVGRKPMPQHTLSNSAQGEDYEARHCALNLLPVLAQHPRFTFCLGTQRVTSPPIPSERAR